MSSGKGLMTIVTSTLIVSQTPEEELLIVRKSRKIKNSNPHGFLGIKKYKFNHPFL